MAAAAASMPSMPLVFMIPCFPDWFLFVSLILLKPACDLQREAIRPVADGAQEPECTLVHEDSEHRPTPADGLAVRSKAGFYAGPIRSMRSVQNPSTPQPRISSARAGSL